MKKLLTLSLVLLLLGLVPTTAVASSNDNPFDQPWIPIAESPDLGPGDLLRAGYCESPPGSSHTLDWSNNDFDRAYLFFINPYSEMYENERWDFVMYGDCLEFAGPPVVTYEDGTVVVGTLEVFTDGEYMTIILDTSKNDMWAELFVRWRITRGTEDSAFFYFENGYCEYESYSSKVSTKEQIKGIPVYSLPLHSPYEPSRTGATRAITELFTITVVQNDIPPTPWFEGYTIYTDDFFLTANIWPIPPAQSTSSTVADKSDPVPSVLPPAVDGIKVILNGKALVFDVPPQIVNGRTLVPLRGIFEEMGAAIEYDGATQTVTATKDGTVVILTIGDTSPAINGAVVPIDQPGIIVDGRTLAPLRFVAEAFGGSVEWNGDTQTATITK